ncbi:MAG TPA: HAMP domain-containing sensor histidine kinase, partial [Bryobacteraceae bacterium]|nr:HAMP domain-containing sensor histidine kinase [Bryobacteraceae bacterium]
CGIGFVQLRWIEQVAKAQRDSALGAIQAGVSRAASTFDHEITRIHIAFETPNPSSDAAAVLRDRFAMWRAVAPYPGLVSEVKLVETARGHGRFPFGGMPGLPGQPGPAPGFVLGPRPDLVDLPGSRNVALLVPVSAGHGNMSAEESGGVHILPASSAAHGAQVVLDMNYIEREFIPDVINRAFAERKADLQILIVSNADPNRVIWRSEPNGEAARRSADVSATFFTHRPECFMAAMRTGPPGTARPDGIPAGEAGPHQSMEASLRLIIGGRTPRCEQPPSGGHPEGNWRIYVRYAAGSVDAVVTRFRSWSIGLSLAVLLILFLAGLTLVLSTERARSLAKVQMEFAAAVSHELRTPLSAIRIAADNLSQGMVENRAQAERYGSLIGAQVQHLTSLVSDVLLFSQSEASPEIPGLEAVGVECVIEDALSKCAADFETAGFRVERRLHTPLPDIVANHHLITQCLINIFQNAIKYARGGKFLGVEASTCHSGSVAGVQIEIVDHGPGIPHDELSRIFEPFYRGREARLSQTPGLGLGLSIVKRIVDGHRGRIDVRTGPNSQTRFRIWIPAADSENGAEMGICRSAS